MVVDYAHLHTGAGALFKSFNHAAPDFVVDKYVVLEVDIAARVADVGQQSLDLSAPLSKMSTLLPS